MKQTKWIVLIGVGMLSACSAGRDGDIWARHSPDHTLCVAVATGGYRSPADELTQSAYLRLASDELARRNINCNDVAKANDYRERTINLNKKEVR